MTLLLTALSALVRREPQTRLLTATGGYDPGAAHRPVAATIAVGLPAALVVAVALSPMIIKPAPRTPPTTVTTIEAEPIKVEPVPQPPTPLVRTPTPATPPLHVPKPVYDPVVSNPVEAVSTPVPPPLADPAPTAPDPAPVVVPKEPAPVLTAARADPRHAAAFQPDYPPYEQRNEIEGVVRVRVLVGTDGRVKAVEQLSATSPGFFAETRRHALAKWRFKPATRDGVPVESWEVMTVRFELKNA